MLTFLMPLANEAAAPPRRPFNCHSASNWTYCNLLMLVTAMLSPPVTKGMVTRLPKVSSSVEKTSPRSSASPSYLQARRDNAEDLYMPGGVRYATQTASFKLLASFILHDLLIQESKASLYLMRKFVGSFCSVHYSSIIPAC